MAMMPSAVTVEIVVTVPDLMKKKIGIWMIGVIAKLFGIKVEADARISNVITDEITAEYARFTKTNASEAVSLIGKEVWFYTKEDLFLSDTRRTSTRAVLAGVNVGHDKPFIQKGCDMIFPFIVAMKGEEL